MPAGRKSGKCASGAQTKSTTKSTKKLSNDKRAPNGRGAASGPTTSDLLLINKDADCPAGPLCLPDSQPDNEIEGVDDGKLSELSADEPESSECMYIYIFVAA